MQIGLDFGTTNSGAAVFDGHDVHVFPLEPASSTPNIVRSALYITRDHEVFVGKEAIDTYYSQNTGRASRLVRQYVGQIEQTFAELPTFVRDVYVLVDELTPGRILRSLKSALSSTYEGTTILGRYYGLEELISLFLRGLVERIEAQANQEVRGIVIGRPVNFVRSSGEEDNHRAVRRLRRAAKMAGLDRVQFELEPIAAALHYGLRLTSPQNVVVFDFGGGTLDITVMRLDGVEDRTVYASGGLGVAGDVFDQRIIERVLLTHFGRGSTFGEERAQFPDRYTDALLNWQTVLELNQPETLRFLEWVQISSSHPSRVHALQSLLVNNLAMRMFDQVEQAKIRLSDAAFSVIELSNQDIEIWQALTRSQFEALISDEARRIKGCLQDTMARSGLAVDQIDAVVRTGGSAQIPCFVALLNEVFGPEKVVQSDVFSSVTAGLAISAYLKQGHGLGD